MTLVLASASPRRRDILAALGIPYEAVATGVEEVTEGDPREVVVENARRKALAGLEAAAGPGDVALGVDTEVVLEGRVLGKASSPEEAAARLRSLSGRTHEVLSGVVIAGPGAGEERSAVASSRVTFRDLDDEVLDLYLASGEWRDRAGAYAIQGLGAMLVERVEGDFSNVVGLPLQVLRELAPELFAGISPAPKRGAEKV